ncbi:hypothetical protein Q6247_25785, partial [Klebsiella pneumoniae]
IRPQMPSTNDRPITDLVDATGTTTDPDHQIAVLGELTQRHQVRSELRNVPDIRNVPDSSSMISLSSMP